MAISRYDYVPNQPSIQTYVPLPYQELYGAVNRKQNELDKAKEQEYQLQNLAATIKTDPYSEQFIKPQIMGRYTDRINTLADTIARGDDYNYKRDVNKLIREYTMDQDVQNLVRSGQNYELYQKDRAKNPNEYVDFYDPYERGFRQTAEGYQGGNVPFFRYEGMKGFIDPIKPAQDLVAGIASDAKGWEAYQRNQDGSLKIENGQIIRNDGKREYITESKLDSIAEANTIPYLQTQGGKYFADSILKRDTSLPGQGISQKELPQVLAAAKQQLKDVGKKQVFLKEYSGQDRSNLSDRALDNLETPNIAPVNIGATAPTNVTTKYRVDIPTNITDSGTIPSLGNPNLGIPGTGATKFSGESVEQSLAKKGFTPEQKVALTKAEKKYGVGAATKVEQAKLINRYLEDFEKEGINIPVVQHSDPKAAERDNLIYFNPNQPKSASAAINRSFKLIQGDTNKELTGKEFLSKFGNEDKYNVTVTGNLTPDNPYFSAGKQVTITDKEGNTVAVYGMSGDRKELAENKFKHEFYQARYNPIGQHKITVPVEKNGKRVNETFTIDYEPLTSEGATLDEEGRPINVGSRARLLDSKGNPVIDWVDDTNDPEGRNSIDLLYNTLPR